MVEGWEHFKGQMRGLEAQVVAVTKQKMMDLEAWAAGVMNQKMVESRGRCLRPRWGRWWFPFKARMRGVVVWAEESTSKGGKSLKFWKKRDMMHGQRWVQQAIKVDGTFWVLRSRKEARERSHVAPKS